MKFNIKKGVLPKADYDADDLIWACDAYHDLVALKHASDDLLQQIGGRTLPTDKQALVDKAKAQYDNFNYLDAYRLLRGALK